MNSMLLRKIFKKSWKLQFNLAYQNGTYAIVNICNGGIHESIFAWYICLALISTYLSV